MAGQTLNRRVLREQTDQVERRMSKGADAAPAPREKKARTKTAAAPKVRRARAKKAPPPMRARWGVFDGSMKQVAIFDYSERAAADEKLADLLAKKKGLHFLQIVKEVIPEPAQLPPAVAG